MTVIRTKDRETRTLLDFSNERFSKNKIKQLLRNLKVEVWKLDNYNVDTKTGITFVDNEIKVGIFTISINLAMASGSYKLKDFPGGMSIIIQESGRNQPPPMMWRENKLFKNQYWMSYNSMGNFKIKHLADVIHYCCRLNKLKCFL
jgi:hypothetical protein